MSYREFFKRFVTIIAILLLLLSAWYLRGVWLRAFLSVILAVGISVPAGWLMRQGMRRLWAYIISVSGLVFVAIILSTWIFPTIAGQAGTLILSLPELFQDAVIGYEEARITNDRLTGVLPPANASTEDITDFLTAIGLSTTDVVSFGYSLISAGLSALPVIEGVGVIVNLATNLLIVFVIAIFLLVEPQTYIRASLLLIPHEYQPRALTVWNRLYHTLTTWLTAQLLSITVTIVLVYLVLGVILGLPFALIVAVFAGLATFIPNVGIVLPIIPIAIFSLADDPSRLWLMVGAYLGVQLIESNIISPSIVKAELSIPSGAVLLFQVISATLFGAGGILLAVPMLAVFITLVRELYSDGMLHIKPEDVEIVANEAGELVLVRDLPPSPAEPTPPPEVEKPTDKPAPPRVSKKPI